MRLTLRTMLAFLDEILEPDDAEEIGKKVAESEYATTIMHRIRDCMRRLRLTAPPLDARGLAMDPNSVAEYLDNTLPTEKVPEFETICLGSDVHLAEVASCHQILTLVLGEPAEIEPAVRDRMYQIQAPVDSQSPASITSPAQSVPPLAVRPPVMPPPPLRKRPRPEVPEYLREPRWKMWPVVTMVCAVALLTIGGLMVFGPRELRNLIGMAGPSPQVEDESENAEPLTQNTVPTEAAPEETAAPAGHEATAESAAPQQPRNEPAAGREGSAPVAAGQPVQAPQPAPAAARVTPEPAPVRAERGAEPSPEPQATTVTAGAAASPAGAAPQPNPADLATATAGTSPPAAAAAALVQPSATGAVPATSSADRRREAEAEGLGRYISVDQVLLELNPASGQWQRVPAKAAVHTGDQLMSLPTFRPTITLSTGTTIVPHDATSFQLEGADSHGVPGIVVQFGLLQIMTDGKAGTQIRIRFGDRSGVVTFADPESIAGIEVRRTLPIGTDPKTEGAAAPAVDVYAVSGAIVWNEGGTPVDMQAPARRTLTDVAASKTNSNAFPDEEATSLEKRGQKAVELKLEADRPIGLGLKEIYEAPGRRQIEAVWLAVRCAAYVDEFGICVRALKDPELRVAWLSDIESLRAALAASPKTAAKVQAAFQTERGADGDELCRMLWGYTREQLRTGAAANLIDCAERDAVDFRVLSSWNLQLIMSSPGQKLTSLLYRPTPKVEGRAADPGERDWHSRVNRWRERLRKDKLLATAPASSTRAPAK